MEKIYKLLIILNLFALFILFSFSNLILFTIIFKFEFIDIKILIDNIKDFIDSKILEKIFEIIIQLGDKIIPYLIEFGDKIIYFTKLG